MLRDLNLVFGVALLANILDELIRIANLLSVVKDNFSNFSNH